MPKSKNTQVVDNSANSKSEQTRIQILSCSATIFLEKGYAATTLRQIAAAANMKAGSIYYHFSSKTEILDEVLNIGITNISDAVKLALKECGDVGPQERLLAAIEAHLRALHSLSHFTSASIRIYSQLPKSVQEQHRLKRKKYGVVWDKLFKQAIHANQIRSDVKIEPLREYVLGGLNWTVEWFNPEEQSLNELVGRCSRLLLNGICK